LAQLERPTGLAVAHNGDLYVADTGHHRVRMISASTGIISTIAGDGTRGVSGDGALAVDARLAEPMGLSLVPGERGLFVYVADTGNNRVRVIDPAGRISTIRSPRLLIAPTRIAYHPAGWLYVKDASSAGVSAVAVSPGAPLTTHTPVASGFSRKMLSSVGRVFSDPAIPAGPKGPALHDQ
jgi:DNA-binding beta-propeller fold protein YncE